MNVIFTVTTGRSGTKYLSRLLGCFPNVSSFHEPDPSFVLALPRARYDINYAKQFLSERKLPSIISNASTKFYAETTHLFCKGFLEAWLDMEELPAPIIIKLNRKYRDVAKSMTQLNSIPGRTEIGTQWYISPGDEGNFTNIACENLNDYQICYWYCLEMDARKLAYSRIVEAKGGNVVDVDMESLKTLSGVVNLKKAAGLRNLGAKGLYKYMVTREKSFNAKSHRKRGVDLEDQQLEALEAEVHNLIVHKDSDVAKN